MFDFLLFYVLLIDDELVIQVIQPLHVEKLRLLNEISFLLAVKLRPRIENMALTFLSEYILDLLVMIFTLSFHFVSLILNHR